MSVKTKIKVTHPSPFNRKSPSAITEGDAIKSSDCIPRISFIFEINEGKSCDQIKVIRKILQKDICIQVPPYPDLADFGYNLTNRDSTIQYNTLKDGDDDVVT